MKILFKKLICITMVFVFSLSLPLYSFALEVTKPGLKLSEPTLHAANAPAINVEDYFNKSEFIDYLVSQLKVASINTSGIFNGYVSIDITDFNIPYSAELAEALKYYIWYESPELFRIAGLGLYYNYIDSKPVFTTIYFNQYYDAETYCYMYDEMVKGAEKLLNDIKGNNNLSDVEKALLIHDRIAILCEYDYDNYLSDSIPQTSYNAYGVLGLNVAVCMGYALAYDYLLDQVGIKSNYCSSNDPDLNHAWNIIYIDNKPYYVDVTWDDPTYDLPGRVKHDNFLLSYSEFQKTHVADDYAATPSDTTFDNYFWKNSNTQFVYDKEKDEFYFVDNAARSLKTIKNIDAFSNESTEVLNLTEYNWGWTSNYLYLAQNNNKIYYATPTQVFEFNPETKISEPVITADLTGRENHRIFGLRFNGCNLNAYLWNSPNKANVSNAYIESKSFHTPEGEWIVIKEPTINECGTKARLCQNCSLYAETAEIEKLLFTSFDENTQLYSAEKSAFTNIETSQNIEDVFAFSDDVTYTVTPALTLQDFNFIGTGTIVKIYKDGEQIDEYTVIVNGDLNGDSVSDVLDVSLTELCLTDSVIPNKEQCFASNGYCKESIDVTSYSFVVNKALAME